MSRFLTVLHRNQCIEFFDEIELKSDVVFSSYFTKAEIEKFFKDKELIYLYLSENKIVTLGLFRDLVCEIIRTDDPYIPLENKAFIQKCAELYPKKFKLTRENFKRLYKSYFDYNWDFCPNIEELLDKFDWSDSE